MTTASDVLTRPAERVKGPPNLVRRFTVAFGAGMVLCLALGAAALAGYQAAYDGRVLPGVWVGGVDLSGMDRMAATGALEGAYGGWADGRVVVHTVSGDVVVPFETFSRGPDVGAMLEAAMAAGRDRGPIERAVSAVRLGLWGTRLEPRLTLDEAALAGAIASGLARGGTDPVDATIEMTAHGVVWTPSRPGRTFVAEPVQVAALNVARRLDAPSDIELEAPAYAIPPARDDATVLAIKAAVDRMTADVSLVLGDRTWTIPAATVSGWITLETAPDGSTTPVVDEAAIPTLLADVEREVRRTAVSATFLTGGSGAIVGVKAGREGRRLDAVATATAVRSELASRASGAPSAVVPVKVIVIEPELTTEEARQTAPLMVRLGRWKTWFPIGERNFWGANIWLPARFINGTVLLPGERFEWWSAVGPITRERGFGMGGVIKGDHTEPTGAIGGGMCSSSTTLFNAALRAGLKMGARSNHRYYIDRYPLGLDATVSGSQTVSFTNDMDHPILIRGFKIVGKGGKGWVRYEIWGVPDGRTVTIGKARVTNVIRPKTETVEVDTLPTGVREQTEWPMRGMDVTVTRVVRDRDGNVLHRNTYRSHYVVWDGRIEVGR